VAGKTNTEAIRDLERALSALEAHQESLQRGLDAVVNDQSKASETLHALDIRLTVLESQFSEWKKDRDEGERRRWALWLAFAGSVLALIVNALLLLLGKK